MKCARCGTENADGLRFCEDCGGKLSVSCAACGASTTPGKKFCGSCGAPVTAEGTSGPAPGSYTPKHLADKILTTRAALEGERKQVTILFADLKGSMELLADRDPEEARQILDPVLELMMEAVHRYEGTVNQVMGDGIMALFGAPLAHEDHAVRACYAALRMQEAIRRYTEAARRRLGIELQIRVGLNSGEVVVRSVGSDLRMDYTAVGQTTHLAARMEQLAPPGTTRLTAETLRLAEGFVQVRSLGPVPVKGLTEPVEIFELAGAAAVRTRLQASHARGFTRFVGRDAELDQIRQAAEQAKHGRGQIVAVVGEPGVGKSRLFYEFIHSHRTHGWLVLEASSVSYGRATPFLPLTDLLRRYFRIEDGDDTRSVRAKVTGVLLTLDRALEDALPGVLWLLDALDPEDTSFLALDPAQRRQRAMNGVKRLLLRESRMQPLLVVFEDLHWLDAETQAVLDSFVESLPTVPVFLAVNYRPEYRHGWAGKTYYRQLRIDPLAPASADELLQTLLGDDASVAPLKRHLVERTEGNPLFLEESVRTLVETRALTGEPGGYRLARPGESVQLPATVQAILAARIDRLSPRLKRLLQAAAIVGKDVPMALLTAVAETAEAELRTDLAELQSAEFLYETRLFPDLEYTFNHALTHEVAYGGVLQDRRRALHATLVEAIERLHADRIAEHVEVLAHHAVRGGLTEQAVRYLRQAAAKSIARSANREAVASFEQALALLDALPQTDQTMREALDVLIALGPALIGATSAAAPEVEALYARACELVDRLGDDTRRFPARWGLWFVNYSQGRYEAALHAAEQLLTIAEAGNDSGQLVEGHHAVWPTLAAMGRPAAAMAHMERGRALYDRERHAAQVLSFAGHDAGACCRYFLAQSHWLLGRPDQALALLREAFQLAEELKHPMTTAVTHWFACWLHHHRGDADATAASAARLHALVEEYGFAAWGGIALVAALVERPEPPTIGELADVRQRLPPSAIWRRVACFCVLAKTYGDVGYPMEGLELLASIGEADRQAFYAPEIYRLEGELLLQRDGTSTDDAEQRFRTALHLARGREEKSLELRAAMSLARLLAARGRGDDARAVLAPVYGWFTEGFETADLVEATALLARLPGA